MRRKKINRTSKLLLALSLLILLVTAGCGGNNPAATFVGSGDTYLPNSDITSSITLSWMAPTCNKDGSPEVDDLAGYIVYYGKGSGNYDESVNIGNFTSTSVSNLTSGTWCFTVTAYDLSGNESEPSDEVCTTLS